MSEIRRVLLSRRTLLYLLIAVFIGSVFFIYDCISEKKITLSGDELSEYISEYPAFLDSVRDNAEEMSALAALSGGFSLTNILKTAEDYEKLGNIVPVMGENKGIVLLSGYIMGDILIMAVTLLIAALFTEERKKGLVTLVRSTENGRRLLSVQRTGIIIIAGFMSSLFVHLALFITAQIACGDMNVLRPIQSVPEFSLCPYSITILEYLIFSVLLKALAAVVSGLILYLLSSIFESAVSIVICAFVIVGEYVLYGAILPTDRFSGLKFCNIAALLRTDIFFKEYCNLNIFENAVSFLSCAVVVIGIAFAALSVACILFTSGYASESTSLGAFFGRLGSALSRKLPAVPLGVYEFKKVFINQKGIIILAAVLYISISSALQYRYVIPGYSELEDQYYNKYRGEISDESVADMNEEYDTLQKNKDRLLKEIEELAGDTSESALAKTRDKQRQLALLDNRIYTLGSLIEKAEDGLSYSKESGITVSLIKTNVYEFLLVNDKATTNKNALYIIIAIVGMFSGICAIENRSNMNSVLKTSLKGRGRLTAIKLGVIGVTSVFTTAAIYLTQFLQIGAGGYNDLEATAQSVEILRFMPFEISILGYIILMFIVRILSAFAVGAVVMLVSKYCRSAVTAICINAVFLIIPAVLSGTGILPFPSAADLIGFTVIQ